MALRRVLHRRGLRYRVDVAPVSAVQRRADIVFAGPKVAVFVDGCFWHGCNQHRPLPRTNSRYWRIKIERNRERDAKTDAALREAGWLVLRFWEHEDPQEAADRIAVAVRKRTASTFS